MAHDAIEVDPTDPEAWEVAFEPYNQPQHATTAYNLARCLMEVKSLLEEQPPRISSAITVLDEAVEVLFPMTEFHHGAYELYKLAIEARATKAHEDLMNNLGIKY